ncbi:MAG: hypothetical protein QNJ47_05215 [Nostocaceae cyanobacterium]|nr:hypothetical protein [Nostocaceae cyanobacterium]
MMNKNKIISISLAILALIASLTGIFANIYRDTDWIKSQLVGQDFVTVFVALILLFISFFNINKFNQSIIQVGLFGYLTYTYITYALGPKLNILFPLYVALISISVLGLITLFIQISSLNFKKTSSFIFTISSIYLILISLILSFLWLGDIIGYLMGKPLFPNPSGEPLTIVYVLDLGFVIPISLYAAIQLLRKKFWGYVLTGVMLIKSTTMGFALMSMTIGVYVYGFASELFLVIFWTVLGLVGLLLSILFLHKLQTNSQVSTNVINT